MMKVYVVICKSSCGTVGIYGVYEDERDADNIRSVLRTTGIPGERVWTESHVLARKTIEHAGKINREWYNDARCNGTHNVIEGWFSAALNANAEILEDLSVCYCLPGGSWRYLTQDRIDQACETIDKGV